MTTSGEKSELQVVVQKMHSVHFNHFRHLQNERMVIKKSREAQGYFLLNISRLLEGQRAKKQCMFIPLEKHMCAKKHGYLAMLLQQ